MLTRDISSGGFCRGGFCRGDFVEGDFVGGGGGGGGSEAFVGGILSRVNLPGGGGGGGYVGPPVYHKYKHIFTSVNCIICMSHDIVRL